MERPVDHYVLLGVAHDATAEAIRAAYVAQAKAWHPDLARTTDAFERFRAIQLAYECLRSPERRTSYDDQIADRANRQLRRIGQAQKRLRKLDRKTPVVAVPAHPVPHWRAAAVVAGSGSLVLSVCYLFLR